MKGTIILTIVVLLVGGFSFAASKHSINLPTIQTELKAGDGREKVEAYCNICHSTDYITMQPRFSKAQWTATVNRMIKVFGCPVNEDDAKKIINYLAANYGTGE